MRKTLSLVLVLSLVLLLTGCVPGFPSAEPVEPIQLGPNEFLLSSLPELEPFTPYSEISARFYPDYTDHLIPRADYGRLYPFAGKVLAVPGFYEAQAVFGLCDEKGRVVVDPVYNSYGLVQVGDRDVLALYKNLTDSRDYGLGDFDQSVCLAAVDGSWVTEPVVGWVLGGDEQAIVVAEGVHYVEDETTGQFVREKDRRAIYIYTPQGELKNTLYASEVYTYSEGTLSVGFIEGGVEEYCLMDIDGNMIFSGQPSSGSTFHGKYAAVCLSDGQYVLMDREGNYDPTDAYTWLYFDESADGFHFSRGDEQGYLDREGNAILQTDGSFSLWRQEDVFNGHFILNQTKFADDWENGINEYRITDETTGATFSRNLPRNCWVYYLGNAWVACAFSQDVGGSNLELYRLQEGQATEAVYGFENTGSPQLVSPNVAAVPLGEVVEEEEYDYSYFQETEVLLLNLETGEEICRIPGSVCTSVPKLNSVMIWPPKSWRFAHVYDETGRLLLDGGYWSLMDAGNGYTAAYGTLYAGLLNEKGEWVIRYCVNITD